MSENKVRLSMEVPGATMLSTQDCVKMSKKDAYDHITVNVEYEAKKGKKKVKNKETLHVYTRRSKPARRSLLINKEAYNYMVGNEAPSTKPKGWSNMNAKQRLEHHLSLIAESFNALSYSYEILDD